MRKLVVFVLLGIFIGDELQTSFPEYAIHIEESPSEFGAREDLMGRMEYQRLLAADPSTGQVPANIVKGEHEFDLRLSRQTAHLRVLQQSYESAGPTNVGGRTRAVAFDIRDEDVILAGGVSGGVWKSIDGGETWTRKSNPENRNSVTCIVQDIRSGHEDTWYHGTGEIVGNSAKGGDAPFRGDGIYKSTDNGESWNLITSTQDSDPHVFNSQFQYIWDIEVNPANLLEDEVLVAAFGGILRSVDGGNTWEAELGQELFGLNEDEDLNESNASFYTSLERSANNTFYAVLSTETPSGEVSPQSGFYYSLDGQVWEDITPLTAESKYRRVEIGTSDSNPNLSYFFIDSNPVLILEHRLNLVNSPGRIKGFDPEPRSLPDFDQSLGNLDTQGSYNMMIRVHPENSNVVFLGGTNLYRSSDGFRTQENIKWIGGYDPEGGTDVYENHHPDQHDLLFFPGNPDIALSASDGGLIRSNDITADSVIWESSNNGFTTSQFFTIAQSREKGDATILGGMQDNGTDLSSAGKKSWVGIVGGDGGYAETTRNSALWYASFQRGQTLRLTLNDDFELTSFGRIDPGSLVAESASLYLFINPFALDPTNENRMFFAGGDHLYYHSNVSQIPGGSQTPTGLGWKQVNETPIDNGLVSAIDISLDGDKLYYGTTNGHLFRLDNATDQLNFVVNSLPEITEGYVSGISVNPQDSDHIIVCISSYNVPSVFESFDGGETFTNVSGNLEENPDGTGNGPSVRWGEIVPVASGYRVFLGTSVGLYAAETLSETTIWIKESQDLIGSAVIPMMDYRASDGSLVIATHGNGVFRTQISDYIPIELQPFDTEQFELISSYPNPFQDETTIQYSIPEDGEVRIDILTPEGALVNTVLWAPQFAGANSIVWDGTTPSGFPLANGIYFYRVRYDGKSKSGRLVLRR